MAQVVECLTSNHEALSSNTSTGKKEKKRNLASPFPLLVHPHLDLASG
jgi:hypothetical protein